MGCAVRVRLREPGRCGHLRQLRRRHLRHDTPLQAPAFGALLGEHLDDLGSPAPITVGPDTPIDVAIARMHEAGVDCVLVVADDRLVGIFTIATPW